MIRPTGNKVLVRPLPPATHTAGGIELPLAYMQPSGQGLVLAAGPGTYDRKGNFIPTELQPGDRVMFSWINGVEINEQGDKILTPAEILALMPGGQDL